MRPRYAESLLWAALAAALLAGAWGYAVYVMGGHR